MLRSSLHCALVLFGIATACAAAPVSPSNPLVPHETRQLVNLRQVTRLDCLYTAGLLVSGRDAPRTLAGLARLLGEKRIAGADVLERPEAPATRGYACLLYMKALGEQGGVLYRLTGPSERYAYKHLKFLRLIPEGGSGLPITGPELVSLLALSRPRMSRLHPERNPAR